MKEKVADQTSFCSNHCINHRIQFKLLRSKRRQLKQTNITHAHECIISKDDNVDKGNLHNRQIGSYGGQVGNDSSELVVRYQPINHIFKVKLREKFWLHCKALYTKHIRAFRRETCLHDHTTVLHRRSTETMAV